MDSRIDLANKVLETLGVQHRISREPGGFYLSWTSGNREYKRRWSCQSNFFPPFYSKMSCGGTMAGAIANLVRYCQGRSVYPLSVWRYWAGDTIRLWHNGREKEALLLLEESDYPKEPICCTCGRNLSSPLGWDWYSFPKEGVGCLPLSGCRQQPQETDKDKENND